MKKNLILLLASATAAMSSLVSCQEQTNTLYYQACFTRVDVSGERYTLVTDDSLRVIPTNKESEISNLPVNTRLIGEFTIPSGEITDPMEVEFVNLAQMLTDTVTVSGKTDTLGNDRIALLGTWQSGGIYGAARFLNINFVITYGQSNILHSVCLAEDTSIGDNPDSEGYYHLVMKHEANNDPESYFTSSTYSFMLDEKYTAEGIKGLKISFNDFSEDEKITLGTETLSSPAVIEF